MDFTKNYKEEFLDDSCVTGKKIARTFLFAPSKWKTIEQAAKISGKSLTEIVCESGFGTAEKIKLKAHMFYNKGKITLGGKIFDEEKK